MDLSCEYSSIFCDHIVWWCVGIVLVWVEEFEADDVLFVDPAQALWEGDGDDVLFVFVWEGVECEGDGSFVHAGVPSVALWVGVEPDACVVEAGGTVSFPSSGDDQVAREDVVGKDFHIVSKWDIST